jgi:3-oxoacyl-[acyl-carrier protein] reductase
MSGFRAAARGAALVTGASRGIGREIALGLAQMRFPVIVNYRARREEADAVVSSITSAGGQACALAADVAREEEAMALVERAEEAMGPLFVLVNNAGITRDRLLLQTSEEDWQATWSTDLLGLRAASREAVRRMGARGGGRIINLSSVVGVTGNAGQANYASAKSAVLGLTRELAAEAAHRSITVNCVIPGYIPTDATAHLTEEQRDNWLRQIPAGRAGTAEEVASAVLFLASDAAGYITGQCLAVDGGLLARAGHGFAS